MKIIKKDKKRSFKTTTCTKKFNGNFFRKTRKKLKRSPAQSSHERTKSTALHVESTALQFIHAENCSVF